MGCCLIWVYNAKIFNTKIWEIWTDLINRVPEIQNFLKLKRPNHRNAMLSQNVSKIEAAALGGLAHSGRLGTRCRRSASVPTALTGRTTVSESPVGGYVLYVRTWWKLRTYCTVCVGLCVCEYLCASVYNCTMHMYPDIIYVIKLHTIPHVHNL